MTAVLELDEYQSYDQATLVLNLETNLVAGVDFLVLVDGKAVSSSGTDSRQELVSMGASRFTHRSQITELVIRGAYPPGTHNVSIELLPSKIDPNPELTVVSASLDGAAIAGVAANVYGTTAYTFDFGGDPPPVAGADTIVAGGPDQIILFVAEDAYQGNAEFTVSVDGTQVGGTYTATAIHSLGQSQEFILDENFAAGSTHQISVDFLNDLYGGSATEDRNLYVTQAEDNGTVIAGSSLTLLGDGSQSFDVTEPGKLTYVGVNEGMGPNAPQVGAGVYGTNWTYPTDAELLYEKSQGMNIIRLGFLDDRVAANASGALSSADLALLDPVVAYATSIGLKVILDDHEYGYWFGTELGTGTAASDTADSEYDKFWANLASNFADNPNVLFGLMNEPNVQTAAQWAGVAQGAIDSIRATGASQEILVSGTNWDGAASWYSTSSDGSSNAVALLGITDPDNNMAFEVHSYPDPSGGGTSAATNTTTGVDRLQAVTQWAITNHETLFLGETGGGTGTTSLEAIDNELKYITANSDVWQGVTEWSAGPWWGNYQYTLEPTQLTDTGTTAYNQPQMTQLDTFAPTYTGSAWTI